MSGTARRLLQCLAVIGCLCASLIGQEQDPRAVAEEILGGRGYQRELPIGDGRGATSEAADAARRARRVRERNLAVDSGLGSIGMIVALAVIGLGLVFAVLGIAGWSPSEVDVVAGKAATHRGTQTVMPHFDPGDQPLADAEALAAEGRFAEAIRVLLHRTFEALHAQQDLSTARWLTSRQILAGARLAPAAHAALAELVGAVEGALFAGRAIGPTDYAACLDAYRGLQAAARGGAA